MEMQEDAGTESESESDAAAIDDASIEKHSDNDAINDLASFFNLIEDGSATDMTFSEEEEDDNYDDKKSVDFSLENLINQPAVAENDGSELNGPLWQNSSLFMKENYYRMFGMFGNFVQEDKDEVPVPQMLQPFCPRELLLSKDCTEKLARNNKLKGKVSFLIIVIIISTTIFSHSTIIPMVHRYIYPEFNHFPYEHVKTTCVVIRSLEDKEDIKTFHDLPYATYIDQFEESRTVETFLDCYWHYWLQADTRLVSFDKGVFYWDHSIMRKVKSDKTAWRLQPMQPGSDEIIGNTEGLSLSISTPDLKGQRPVLVLVTGNDLTYNKPVLPSPKVVSDLDCVVVTVNYRLGLDGAAVLNRENFMGNLFVRDVISALAWLNRTVQNFGGDAGRIVYFGEGSGATMGLWLMLSPEAVFVNRFWLMDPSVEIYSAVDLAGFSVIEDIFRESPSPLLKWFNERELDECYKEFKSTKPASCLMKLPQKDLLSVSPKWTKEIYSYLDQFPDWSDKNTMGRSLLHLPPAMLNYSLMHNLRAGRLRPADKPLVVHYSSSSEFYSTLFPVGSRNYTRFDVETALRTSLERIYTSRNTHRVGTSVVKQYVNMLKMEMREDQINYEEVRRVLLYDIRAICPIMGVIYHVLQQRLFTQPLYNLMDLSPYQSVPILAGKEGHQFHCNLPRFLIPDFDNASTESESNPVCRLQYDVGVDGIRQLREYRDAAINILSDFAYSRNKSDLHPHYMIPAALGEHGTVELDQTTNVLDHKGSMPGVDTKRSQLIKTVCHELQGPMRDNWHTMMFMAKLN